MTWRERALQAKEYGWTREDRKLWTHKSMCPAAEIAEAYGVRWGEICEVYSPWLALWRMGDSLVGRYSLVPPDEFLARLDKMEDKALEIKRGFGAKEEAHT